MRQLRGWMVWAALAICALMVLGTLTGLTKSVLRSERKRAWLENRDKLQESERAALLSMDLLATAWITDEAQRSVLPMGLPEQKSAEDEKPEVLLRFEAREDGAVISGDPNKVILLEKTLEVSNHQLFAKISGSMPPLPAAWSASVDASPVAESPPRQALTNTQYADVKERAGRERVVNLALNQSKQTENVANNWAGPTSTPSPSASWQLLQSGMPRPALIGSELFLLRHLHWRMPGGQMIRTIQGTWIDASGLQAKLLTQISDLFPQGRLTSSETPSAEVMTLVSFPFWRLESGVGPDVTTGVPGEVWGLLGPCWCAALTAITIASLLVHGVMRLSDRRASFVSAVTHELRTPLTTFRLYSEMLESGAVKEEKRSDYLRILSREADRLAHLVENVLAFSRIERGSARTAVRETSVRDLLEPLRERFEARLNIAGMELRMNLQATSADTQVKVDAAAVEHILFNLVDNAAKYAAGGDPPEVTVRIVAKASSLGIYVEDYGPGIPPAKRDRIFQPFHKSARDAAESRPGVGLGLALSRRLARSLGGDLLYERRPGKTGACFMLRLPLE
jgi:signal transduction histidine kinase